MHPWLGVELHHLATLAAVAQAGSFRRAAAELGCAPSAVSQRSAALARAAGVRRVEGREGRRAVGLTAAGALVVERGGEVLSRLRAARADLEAVARGRAAPVRLAVASEIGPLLLERLLTAVAGWPAAGPGPPPGATNTAAGTAGPFGGAAGTAVPFGGTLPPARAAAGRAGSADGAAVPSGATGTGSRAADAISGSAGPFAGAVGPTSGGAGPGPGAAGAIAGGMLVQVAEVPDAADLVRAGEADYALGCGPQGGAPAGSVTLAEDPFDLVLPLLGYRRLPTVLPERLLVPPYAGVTAQLAAAGIRALPVALPGAGAPRVGAGGRAGRRARAAPPPLGGRGGRRPPRAPLAPRAIVLSWDPARRMTPQLVAFRAAAIAAFAPPEPAPLALTA